MIGIRNVLARPRVYEAWSRLVGGEQGRSRLVREYVKPSPGARVLDLGCGPGELVPHLGDVSYVGVDVSDEYIGQARRAFGEGAEFRVADATALDRDLRDFDLVLAFGVLHHMDDDGVARLLEGARRALRPRGRFIAVEPVRIADMSLLARLFVSADRGRHVRGPDEYGKLTAETFGDVRIELRDDLLRIPYKHCVLAAEAP